MMIKWPFNPPSRSVRMNSDAYVPERLWARSVRRISIPGCFPGRSVSLGLQELMDRLAEQISLSWPMIFSASGFLHYRPSGSERSAVFMPSTTPIEQGMKFVRPGRIRILGVIIFFSLPRWQSDGFPVRLVHALGFRSFIDRTPIRYCWSPK
jgi:hypothetical protein